MSLYKYNNKKIAKKAYEAGETIILYANKVRPDNMWIAGYEINISHNPDDFDVLLANFEVYNCNYENGYYTSFYVEVA